MSVLIISLAVLAAIAAVAGIVRTRSLKKKIASGEIEAMPKVKMVTDCGADSCELDEGGTCDNSCLRTAVKQEIEYYDDEELDRFTGKDGGSYTDEEVEEFGEILDTMLTEDVPGWVHSLELRRIALPDQLRDEVFMLIRESNSPKNADKQ